MTSVQRSGQAARLDRFVITSAIESLAAHSEACISINISGSSFASPDFSDFVESLLARFGINPARIIFELTENEVITNITTAIAIMTSLKTRGFRFALDDFGSGTSSLNYLKSLPVDLIKIDGTFINRLQEDPFNQAVVRAVRALSASLKIPMVAEHVETQAVFDLLASIGVEYAQGYLIGEPRTVPYKASEIFKP